jgi:hypothetical protein
LDWVSNSLSHSTHSRIIVASALGWSATIPRH